MTKDEFMGGFILVWSLRDDLPDGMDGELREQKDEITNMLKSDTPVDWDNEREILDDLCREYGFPSVFGGDHV